MKLTDSKKTRDEMLGNEWWIVPLMDFVDDFRWSKDPALLQPFELCDERMDAILASTIERLCSEMDIPLPSWVEEVPPCRRRWFVSET